MSTTGHNGIKFRFDATVTAEGDSPAGAVVRLLGRLGSLGFGITDQDGNQRQIVVGCLISERQDIYAWSTYDVARWHASTRITDEGEVQA